MLARPQAARSAWQGAQRALLSSTAARRTHPTQPLDPLPPRPDSTPATPPPPHPSAAPNASAGPSASSSAGTTHFGFRDVPEQMKESLVKGVFSSVASSYDVMNDAMSLGIHRLWKDHYVSKLDPHGGLKCLDVAGGTGDIAMRILDHAREKYGDRETSVSMLDINPEMLEEGKKRFAKTMYHNTPQVSFHLGNAEHLEQFADNTFDLYTIAFGIRNCTHPDKVVEEAYRVLKPGGVLSVLEFSNVPNPILSQAYDLWSFNVIPALGHILASDRDSYAYLVESIRRFYKAPEFAEVIRKAGFQVAQNEPWEPLTFGIAAIHTGVKV
ncbi:2-hexaprenyl-6-methoxy-1,4-benzoquinone methyltransferase [Rhodotorula toruloides]